MVDYLTSSLLDVALNSAGRCLLCGAPADLDLCVPCEQDLPRICQPCRRCALPLYESDEQCGQCLKSPPPFERSVVPFEYRWPVDALVNGFKTGGKLPMGRLLTLRLAQMVRSVYPPDGLPGSLVVTPVRLERLRERGFNQALQIARLLGRKLELSVKDTLLQCERKVASQKSLPARARRQNLRGAFRICRPTSGHIALIDDVMTTGATAGELSKLLLGAGASRSRCLVSGTHSRATISRPGPVRSALSCAARPDLGKNPFPDLVVLQQLAIPCVEFLPQN